MLKIMYFIHQLFVSYLLIIFGGSLYFPLLQTSAHLPDPVPVPWPEQFHSILFVNTSKGKLWKTDLWYDWPKGRNFNINQHQLGKLLYNLEWDNGTSFYYTLDSNQECEVMHFEVGILRPNWLDGAKYLGQKSMDGFLCNVWEKADFVWYYEDVDTKQPVFWEFYTGIVTHVMTFEVGRVLEDPNWQAPQYCFKDAIPKAKSKHVVVPFDSLFPGEKFRREYTMPKMMMDS